MGHIIETVGSTALKDMGIKKEVNHWAWRGHNNISIFL